MTGEPTLAEPVAKPAPLAPGVAVVVLHTVVWQAGWFAAVLGAARGHDWAGPAALVPLVALHAWVHRHLPAYDLRPLGIAAMLGFAVDALLGQTGVISMARGDGGWTGWPTPWMLSLWVALASGLSFGLRWMQGRWLIAVAFGAVGGALAYVGGERLGALRLPLGLVPGALIVAVAWGIAMPVLMYLLTVTRRMVSRG
jgi:hypothetical protein